eukprot:2521386-Amphidinium_carterae.1
MSAVVTPAHQTFSSPADLTPLSATGAIGHTMFVLQRLNPCHCWILVVHDVRVACDLQVFMRDSSQSRHHRPPRQRCSVQTYAWEQV